MREHILVMHLSENCQGSHHACFCLFIFVPLDTDNIPGAFCILQAVIVTSNILPSRQLPWHTGYPVPCSFFLMYIAYKAMPMCVLVFALLAWPLQKKKWTSKAMPVSEQCQGSHDHAFICLSSSCCKSQNLAGQHKTVSCWCSTHVLLRITAACIIFPVRSRLLTWLSLTVEIFQCW